MANIINVDCHLVNVRGHRYIERITEIIPTENRPYPSKKKLEEMGGMDIKGAIELEHLANEYIGKNPNWRDLTYMDASSYFERVTDPEVFTVKDIIRWESTTEDDSEGTFVLCNMPSDEMIEDMKLMNIILIIMVKMGIYYVLIVKEKKKHLELISKEIIKVI